MDNFKAVYRILSTLEKAMDLPDFDMSLIGPEKLGVSEERWARYIEMMDDVGYIKGARIESYIDGTASVDASKMRITLKGLEYLQENSMMQKMYRMAKGIKDVIRSIGRSANGTAGTCGIRSCWGSARRRTRRSSFRSTNGTAGSR